MKTHYCPADKAIIDYEGECNWCGEREHKMTFDQWYDTVVKHVTPADIYQWMHEAWEAGQQAEREACAQLCENHAKKWRSNMTQDCANAIRLRNENA